MIKTACFLCVFAFALAICIAQDAAQMPNGCSVKPVIQDLTSEASWNGWGADTSNTRFQSQAGFTAADVPRLKLKWAFGFPGAKAVSGQPAVVAGRVFVSVDNGYVYSLNATTGCVYWSFHAEASVRSSATVQRIGGRFAAYFGDARANVYAIDASTGDLIWKVRVEEHPTARITGAPKFFAGRLYVPVASGEEGAGGKIGRAHV